MEKPEIKLATSEEYEWVAKTLSSSEPWVTLGATFEKSLKTCIDNEYLVYIAHIEGKPGGAIILHKRGVASSPYVKSIVVSEEFRSLKIGEALMEFAENLFREEFKHIFLCVSSFNTRAQKFYNRLGYEAVGEFKDYIIDGYSEILMHKRLK